MTRPVILQIGPYPEADQAALDAAFDARRYFEAADKPAFLAANAAEVRGVATRGDLGVTREIIEALPKLEIIAVYGVGYDGVDVEAARARGVRVTNTPDVLTDDVADLAIGMMIARARDIVGGDAWVRSGSWGAQGAYPLQRRISGLRAGVLGLGRIGAAIARRAEAFGMTIAYGGPRPKPGAERWAYHADPVALAAASDVLFVALAASAATRHLVDRRVIDALGPTGMLVNISRASNVDEAALLDALETGRLGSAALDVFDGEPQVDPRWFTLPNVLLQPHVGSATVDTRRAMAQLMRDNLSAHFAGREPLTPVA